MKLLFLAISIVISTASPSKDGAVFSFTGKTMFMFADVKEGEQLSHSFEFINSGNVPLIISDFKVACSCTKAIFPKEPILPGQKSEIKITFDTNGKFGFQDRIVKVYSNANKSPIKLRVKVFVQPKE